MGIEIAMLNAKVQKMVLENQQKFNPNLNSTIDDDEIGVLLAEAGVSSQDELLSNAEDKENLSKRMSDGIRVTRQSDRTKDMVFYAGQYSCDVDEEGGKIFRDLDLNNDGKLSEDEIASYKRYMQLMTIKDKANAKESKSYGTAVFAINAPVLGGLGMMGSPLIGLALTAKMELGGAIIAGLGCGVAAGVGLAALTGYAAYKIHAHCHKNEINEAKEQRETYKQEFQQLEQQKKQYSQIYTYFKTLELEDEKTESK